MVIGRDFCVSSSARCTYAPTQPPLSSALYDRLTKCAHPAKARLAIASPSLISLLERLARARKQATPPCTGAPRSTSNTPSSSRHASPVESPARPGASCAPSLARFRQQHRLLCTYVRARSSALFGVRRREHPGGSRLPLFLSRWARSLLLLGVVLVRLGGVGAPVGEDALAVQMGMSSAPFTRRAGTLLAVRLGARVCGRGWETWGAMRGH